MENSDPTDLPATDSPAAGAYTDPSAGAAPAAASSGSVLYSHAQSPEYREGSELFVLTADTIYLTSPEDKATATALKDQIDAGADPDAALRASDLDDDDVKRIPVSSVTRVVTFGDERHLGFFWNNADGAEKEATAWLTNDAAKAAALAAVRSAIGPVREEEEEASLLHVGTLPLVGIGAGVLFAVIAWIAAALAGSGCGRNVITRVLGLFNILGTTVSTIIALAIIGACGFWWFTLSKNRPMKTTLTRTA